jgi:hypothetical protein
MTMSLKVRYADEIVEAMASQLQDESFMGVFQKEASLRREAGAALVAFKKDEDAGVQVGTDLDKIYTKHLPSLQAEENKEQGTISEARKYMAEKARTPGHRQPGLAYPEADDDACECDGKMGVAADFALQHLVKVADALDKHGFATLANELDEAMQKIAAKKKG